MRRVRGPAVLPVGSRAGAGRQGTVHTPISSLADGSYHLCLGEISSSWNHFRAGKEGRMGGPIWEAEPRETAAGRCVCCLCMCQGSNCKGRRALQTGGTRINGWKWRVKTLGCRLGCV